MTDALSDTRLREIREQIDAAAAELGEVCKQGPSNRFRMRIPADPKRDTDLIIAAALKGGSDLLAEVDRLRAQLEAPCGSCHPCTNYSDETWRAAGRKPPHVHEWDEARAEIERLREGLGALVERCKQGRRDNGEYADRVPGANYEYGKATIYDYMVFELGELLDPPADDVEAAVRAQVPSVSLSEDHAGGQT